MLLSYLKIAFRNFAKARVYSFINIFGLAIGMACTLMILLYVQDEFHFDRFHEKSSQIYRVVEKITGDNERYIAYSKGPLGKTISEEFPEVEGYAQFFRGWRITIKHEENRQIVRDYFFTDGSFTDLFDFEMIAGDPQTAFRDPHAVVLTETTARQLFGDADPLGQMISVEAEDFPEFGDAAFQVSGVMKDAPHNSHLDFRLLISYASLKRFETKFPWLYSWQSSTFITYLLLDESSNISQLQLKLPAFAEKHMGDAAWEKRPFYLQPLTDIHFYSDHILYEFNQHKGNLNGMYVLVLIAGLIILIACINYMNLATARSINRAREVGLRKVVGARKQQLTGQFLSESLLTAFLSLIAALVIVELTLPQFNQLIAKQLAFNFVGDYQLFLGVLFIALLVGFLSGSYPALHLSGFQPISILKGSNDRRSGSLRFRRVLVVTQFTLSMVMISATLIIFQQLQYISDKPLGFNHHQLAVIDINHDDVQTNFLTIKEALQNHPAITSVAVSSRVPGDWKSFREINVFREDDSEDEFLGALFNAIDEDFLQCYQAEIVQGRNFDRDIFADSSALLINETAARQLFSDSPIGKTLRISRGNFEGQIVGVVKDFHFHSLHSQIAPLIMGFIPASGSHAVHGIDYFTVRVNSEENFQEALAHINSVHNQFDPLNPLEADFLSDWLNTLYAQDSRSGKIFGIAATLAILIACVGLFGLSAFMAEQRTKEIGVRKVLGASLASIIILLTKDFSRLLFIAFLVAIPLAYLAMNSWLGSFAYRIPIYWWVFAIAGSATMIIALLTVSWQALRAATTNPVKALRYE